MLPLTMPAVDKGWDGLQQMLAPLSMDAILHIKPGLDPVLCSDFGIGG